MPNVSVDKLEKSFRRAYQVKPLTRPSVKELVVTFCITSFVTPFFLMLFANLPLMGQIVVGFAGIVTVIYLYVRRSILVVLAGGLGSLLFFILTIVTIQAMKLRLDIALFTLLALGIPVAIIYCLFLGLRIAELLGVAD